MKKLVLSAAFLALGTFAMAQQNQKMQKMDPAQMEQKRATHLKEMQSELKLTDAQVLKIKALQDQRMAERKENAPKMQAERKAKRTQIDAKRAQHEAEMKQNLTPEQFQKWQLIKKDRMYDKGKMMKSKKMMRMQSTK